MSVPVTSDATVRPPDNATPAPVLTNIERLRTHLTPGGLAVTLMDAWKKDDPEAQGRMLTALHDFHKPK
jgi:hypothetical protein